MPSGQLYGPFFTPSANGTPPPPLTPMRCLIVDMMNPPAPPIRFFTPPSLPTVEHAAIFHPFGFSSFRCGGWFLKIEMRSVTGSILYGFTKQVASFDSGFSVAAVGLPPWLSWDHQLPNKWAPEYMTPPPFRDGEVLSYWPQISRLWLAFVICLLSDPCSMFPPPDVVAHPGPALRCPRFHTSPPTGFFYPRAVNRLEGFHADLLLFVGFFLTRMVSLAVRENTLTILGHDLPRVAMGVSPPPFPGEAFKTN